MRKNISPWIHQLNHDRTHTTLTSDTTTDVAIVGAGIAGMSTAFFILKNTDKKVVLLERFKLAHGATGHNAGQVTTYFERGFASIVGEFGLERAAAGQRAVEDAWALLDEMYTDSELDIPFSRFLGHAGLSSHEQILWHLSDNLLRKKAGLPTEQIHIADSAYEVHAPPAIYDGLYEVVPHDNVLAHLETKRPEFIATLSYQKGCINSALLCQEVLTHLLKTYPDRFSFFEHTPIHKIVLRDDGALLDAETHTVTCERVVLCTNGFENIRIFNRGLEIDTKYHYLISGKVGYMSGYLEAMDKPPTAISYFTDPVASTDNSYYYLTRRVYEKDAGSTHNLICIGGPDTDLAEDTSYSHEAEYPDEAGEAIDAFVRHIYDLTPNTAIEYLFTWHGLMGYTKNKLRLIGPEPKSPTLLYNLGCNGVGILPSIHGGKKISEHIAGAVVEPSIFDVPLR